MSVMMKTRLGTEMLAEVKSLCKSLEAGEKWKMHGTTLLMFGGKLPVLTIVMPVNAPAEEKEDELRVRTFLLESLMRLRNVAPSLVLEVDFARRAMDAFVTMNAYAARVKAAGTSDEDRKMALDIFMAAEKSLSKTIEEYKCWAAELPHVEGEAGQGKASASSVKPAGK